jgi:hypothetical protein
MDTYLESLRVFSDLIAILAKFKLAFSASQAHTWGSGNRKSAVGSSSARLLITTNQLHRARRTRCCWLGAGLVLAWCSGLYARAAAAADGGSVAGGEDGEESYVTQLTRWAPIGQPGPRMPLLSRSQSFSFFGDEGQLKVSQPFERTQP